MQTFIEEVVQSESKITDEEKLYIVPSRRAGSKLRNVLASITTTTSFAPEIYAIEEFIAHISGLRQANHSHQLFTLFESYLATTPKEHQETFRTFCGWAQTILADFNEIDRYLISKKSIFSHLKDIKDLSSHWSQDASSELIINYLKFWNNLEVMYDHFCEELSTNGLAHQGLMYRRTVENLEAYLQSNSKKRHIFLGFNALNNAEQQILQEILATGNSISYWDVERHFQDNPIHEVSTFTRSYKKQWPYFKNEDFKWVSNNYTRPKTIKTYACTSNITLAKTLSTLIEGLTSKELENTAIILGEESLLLPLLNALPSNLKKLNITMGISLSQTPAASFFDALFTLKRNPSPKGYYHREIIELLSHQLSRKLLKSNFISQKIINDNIIFATAERLTTFAKGEIEQTYLEELFKPWENPKIALDNCLNLIALLRRELLQLEDKLLLEYLFGFYKVFNQLISLQEQNNYIEDIPTLTFFYRDILSSETVDLRGDPEQGLQIMGVLESRVLDYKRVMVTSVNEGILPSGKSQNSFIPYDLKREYGLPTYFEKDAIYAYHFYKMLYRSENIALLYTTENEGLGSVEKSRFIRQLEEERVHTIEHINSIPPLQKNINESFTIDKSPEVMHKLKELCKKGLSPSALTTYLRNPLKFYEQYVLGVRETNTVEETVEANTLGTIVHNALEALYTPYIGQSMTEDDLKRLIPNIEATVGSQFESEYGLEFIKNGKNLIIYEVILRYIANYIKSEIQKIKKGDTVVIQSLENDLREIPLTENVNLRGKVDLVEKRNGNLNVIDYKTGKVEQRDLNLSHWEDLLLPEGKREKAFQVLMYAYMLHKKEPLPFPVSVGIISFKNLKTGYLAFHFNKDALVTEDTLLEFERILKQLVAEILNPDIPFAEREV